MHFVSVIVFITCITVAFSIPMPSDNGSSMDDIMAVNDKSNELVNVLDVDVKMTDKQMAEIKGDVQNGLTKKTANLRWPEGVLHYTLSNSFANSYKELIRAATREIESHTCITLKEHPLGSAPNDHVAVYPGSGCWSYIGRTKGKQLLSIQVPGCHHQGTIIHEFLHALGVNHEQSRKDRDNYVTINWGNIQAGLESNFQKRDTDSLGVGYDYKSVMHYSNYAFSKNRLMTLYATNNPSLPLGGKELTVLDIKQLNLFYDCNGPVTTKSTTIKTTTTKPKTTTTTTKPTTTTTTTTTPKTTTTTTTTTMKPTTTRPITKSTIPPTTVCGDSSFKCVNAYYYPEYMCRRSYYRRNCQQSCGVCDNGDDEIQCGNFKDKKKFDCYGKAMAGHCTIRVFRKRYRMKKNCPRTCCEEGRIYF